MLDDHSRLGPVGCTAMLRWRAAAAFDADRRRRPVGRLGPARFWSDNAKAFTATLAAALAPIGVAASHTRPYSPQTAATLHQTVQKWLAEHPAPPPSTAQAQLDLFRIIYNRPNDPTAPSADASRRRVDPRPQERPGGPAPRPANHRPRQHRPRRQVLRRALRHHVSTPTTAAQHCHGDNGTSRGHVLDRRPPNPATRRRPNRRTQRSTVDEDDEAAGHRPPPVTAIAVTRLQCPCSTSSPPAAAATAQTPAVKQPGDAATTPHQPAQPQDPHTRHRLPMPACDARYLGKQRCRLQTLLPPTRAGDSAPTATKQSQSPTSPPALNEQTAKTPSRRQLPLTVREDPRHA